VHARKPRPAHASSQGRFPPSRPSGRAATPNGAILPCSFTVSL